MGVYLIGVIGVIFNLFSGQVKTIFNKIQHFDKNYIWRFNEMVQGDEMYINSFNETVQPYKI